MRACRFPRSRTADRWIGALLFSVLFVSGSSGALLPVHGSSGMVVAGHPEATEIGLKVLREGGNAMDAVVATSLALGVAEPYGSGLGGKGAILYYDAASRQVHFVDGMDAAGGALDVSKLAAMSSADRAEGAHGIGVPGLLAALALAHKEWGREPWEGLVLPAAELSEKGFLVVPGMSVFFERRLERIRSHPETRRIYLPEDAVPPVGTRLPNADLARTLRRIASEGPAGFYDGEVAAQMVAAIQAGGGHLLREDFSAYRARMGTPFTIPFAGLELFAGGPPTTGGATAFLSLKVLETHPWDLSAGFHAAENLDAWARTLRHVYPRIQGSIADSPRTPAAWDALIDSASVERLREAAERPAAVPAEPALAAAPTVAGDAWTTHFVVVDRDGNMASVTQSLSHHFGSGVTAPGTGVVLNNSLTNFSYRDRQSPNFAAPDKRPRSTIAPIIAMRDGEPVLAFGLPGGGRIPTTTLALLVDHLVFGRDLGAVIAAPRVHLLRSWSEEADSNQFQLEPPVSAELQSGLEALGWEVEVVADTEFFGGVTAIERDPDGGLTGWADERRTNHAAGF